MSIEQRIKEAEEEIERQKEEITFLEQKLTTFKHKIRNNVLEDKTVVYDLNDGNVLLVYYDDERASHYPVILPLEKLADVEQKEYNEL